MAKVRPKREGIMLCYPTDEGRVRRLGEKFLGQPKIRGERCHIEWFAEEPVFISSYGNEFKFLDHLKAPMKEIFNTLGEVPFDGELYRHGWSQEQISGILRSTVNRHSDVEGLQYHIFDLKELEEALFRMALLKAMEKQELINHTLTPLKLVPTTLLNQENWMDYATECIDQGYEGAVLRRTSGLWVAKRTVDMLKFKPTEKDDYVIVSVNEAIDKHGNPKGMVGSFLVKAPDVDEVFKVGAGKMKHPRRIELWKMRTMLPGKMLTVKHELLRTSGNVPVCAVAVEVLL